MRGDVILNGYSIKMDLKICYLDFHLNLKYLFDLMLGRLEKLIFEVD